MALFVPPEAPLHDNVTLSSERVALNEQDVGALQAVVLIAQLMVNTIWLKSSLARNPI
ncbi:hypothetical protein [Thermoanaerobacterium thermosaccharolyticum]|jgi:hypothetical protein|uniref:hypothetical protein n=1 Tax=Thermoanaerobacterium thermosaccharolyticum TaxID=1517 RepID=UPI003DA9BEB6